MNRVYLAGPPYADEYRRRAEALVRELGWEPVDPMRRDYRDRTEGNEAEIVEGDLAEIDSCDAVLAAFTAPDEGTAMEAWYATACENTWSRTRAAYLPIRGRSMLRT
jgi:nucleoside 2-deoxyribosyltransferase